MLYAPFYIKTSKMENIHEIVFIIEECTLLGIHYAA